MLQKMFFFLCFLTYVQISETNAGTLNCEKKDLKNQSQDIVKACESNPTCISEADFLAQLTDKNNPEEALKKLTLNSSDNEVLTRLIYSEFLATHCFDQDTKINEIHENVLTGIALVISNRYKAAKNDRQIVFQKQQFRSSTGSCDVATRKDWLCPISDKEGPKKDFQKKIYVEAQKSLEKALKNTDKSYEKLNFYYFHKHFDQSVDCGKWKGVEPAWTKTKKEVPIKIGTIDSIKKSQECVGFYDK